MSDFERDIHGREWAPCAACPHPTPGACPSRAHRAFCRHVAERPEVWGPKVAALPPELREPRPGPPTADATPGVPTIDPDTFITTAKLAADTVALAARVPADVDLVVAVPRSGLPPAAIIASLRHLPMWQVVGNRVEVLGGGYRISDHPGRGPDVEPRHVLIVDDTVGLGGAMRRALPAVQARWPGAKVTRACVYCHPAGREFADLYHASYDGRHYLEWNWQNAGHGDECGYDFDGILCEECPREDDDGGERYRRFLLNAAPLFLPRRRVVPLIVTARHRRWEPEVRTWLDRYGVRVDRLVMRDFERPKGTSSERARAYGRWKGEHYAADGRLVLFAESDPRQAEAIAETSGKPVLCPAAGRVFRRQPITPPAPPVAPRVVSGPGTRDPWGPLRAAQACDYRVPLSIPEQSACGCSGHGVAACLLGRSDRLDGRMSQRGCMACQGWPAGSG